MKKVLGILSNRIGVPSPGQSAPWFLVVMGLFIIIAPGAPVIYMLLHYPNIYNPAVIGVAMVCFGVLLAYYHDNPLMFWLCHAPFIIQTLATLQYTLEARNVSLDIVVYVGYLWMTFTYVYHLDRTVGNDSQ